MRAMDLVPLPSTVVGIKGAVEALSRLWNVPLSQQTVVRFLYRKHDPLRSGPRCSRLTWQRAWFVAWAERNGPGWRTRRQLKEKNVIKHNCTCAEGRLADPDHDTPLHIRAAMDKMPRDKSGKIIAPQVHDCEYVALRNSLIPEAERRAAAVMVERHGDGWDKKPSSKPDPGSPAWQKYKAAENEYTRLFMDGMTILVAQARAKLVD